MIAIAAASVIFSIFRFIDFFQSQKHKIISLCLFFRVICVDAVEINWVLWKMSVRVVQIFVSVHAIAIN